jgi:hypothetical protein
MVNKNTQIKWVQSQLNKTGKISRNACLAKYISRLADIVFKLRKQGYPLEGRRVKTRNGEDYVYEIVTN